MRWYNPKTRIAETVGAPQTDEDAEHVLGGHINSWAFLAEYDRRREDGMPIEQAMIFVADLATADATHSSRPAGTGKPLKASRLEDYVPRRPRIRALQQVLFPYHEARA